jgi:1,4-alpha-glucan branching enzyme
LRTPRLELFSVDREGILRPVPSEALHPQTMDLARFPYGAVVLPWTGSHGETAVVFKQPATEDRNDVLVIEKPTALEILSETNGVMEHATYGGLDRVRVAMEHLPRDAGELPASVAVVRFAVRRREALRQGGSPDPTLTSVAYTIRANDQPGWFDFRDSAFPDTFRHGHPDIATREQGRAGIRGPSLLAAGLYPGIRDSHSRPRLPQQLEDSERVIYELHIGTFTPEGNFAAAAERLAYVKSKGFTTIQLMPVDISSGPPGWTYDQTRTGAVETAEYGGAAGLIAFVERAHELGMEVIVDKQYNHGGPEQDSRTLLIPQMFDRHTLWGGGLSGKEAPTYFQIVKLIGEELAYWATQFGLDGFRFDATNRLPWEIHEQIACFGRDLAAATGKPLYLLSEYAECEEPRGRRVPTGHQYADQTGRLLLKLLDLSHAEQVTSLPADDGSLLRAMLKAARRGWWYPDVPPPEGGLRSTERSTTLLWNHDWIGNRFGGERINHVVDFSTFKAIAVWQAFGQWTPFVFMGTERYARTPWYFFTGHMDAATRNSTSAYYTVEGSVPALTGGRFHEFAPEAKAAGLREAMAFSRDGTLSGIDWEAFRQQTDREGRGYRDHADRATFEASKLDWNHPDGEQQAIETLFEKVFGARQDPRLREPDPRHTQYKAWDQNERVFVLRRREPGGEEFVAMFNLGGHAVALEISKCGVAARDCGRGYIIALRDGDLETEWSGVGHYAMWLDTNTVPYGGTQRCRDWEFDIDAGSSTQLDLAPATALVFSKFSKSRPGNVEIPLSAPTGL